MATIYTLQDGDKIAVDEAELRSVYEQLTFPKNDAGGRSGGVSVDFERKTISWWSDKDYGSGISDLLMSLPNKKWVEAA